MIELPGYKLLNELGRGGMARVYLALHEGLDRHVAIKLMYPNLSADPAFSDRFLREARIVARLNHPNIITIFDVNVHQGYHYIAMEYLPGESLGDKIKAGIEPAKALSYLKQMAMGLKFAHDKGFIHRDIKPENILFREDGSPVITDFGVARAELSDTRMTEVGTIIGTPHYMSPEQAQGIEIKSNSDIYSLGIVFYEMLTGVVPYRADSIVAIMYKHVNDPIPELTGKLVIFQLLLDKLLAKNAGDRYQCAADIIRDIERIEIRMTPDLATRIIPPKVSNEAHAAETVLYVPKKNFGFNGLAEKKYALAIGAFVLVSTVSAVLFSNLPDNKPPPRELAKVKQEKQSKQDRQLANLIRIEEERARKEAQERQAIERAKAEQTEKDRLARDNAERERRAAQQEKLAQEKRERERKAAEKEKLALVMRDKAKKTHDTEQKINRLIATAEASLQKNSLKDAYSSYQQVLGMDADNKTAKKGVDRVAEKYLGLAVSKAKKSSFDTADAYVRSASKISPEHPKLASTQQTIADLKNRRLAETTQQKNTENQSDVSNQKSPEKIIPKQRSFGGF